MKSSIAKGLLSSLFLNVCLLTTAHAATVTLFPTDTFADITTGDSITTGGSSSAWNGAGRYVVTNAYKAGGAVRIGKSDATGSITTTNLVMQAGTLHVQTKVKGWTTVEGQLRISVAGQSTNITYTAKMADSFQTVAAHFVVPAGTNTVTLATTAKRCFLDDLMITEDVSSGSAEPVFTVEMQSGITVEELSPVQFTITAVVNGNPTNVTYTSGLPSGASYTFSNGAFSWTPALGQAGAYALVFSAKGSDGQLYPKTVNITVNTLPLSAPTGLAASNIDYNAFDASWNPVVTATQGYRVTVWYGSATNTPTADVETFFETTDNNPVQPWGWLFTGITGEYMPYAPDFNEVSLDNTGDSVITKWYPKAVTSLSFHLQGRSTVTTADSIVKVYGTDDGTTWTELASYSSLADADGDNSNNIYASNYKVTNPDMEKSISVPHANGYRKFKFIYANKVSGNVGLGNIATEYDGAGTKFVSGWYNTAVADTGISVSGARANRDYYVLVGAKNSTETKSSLLVLTTSAATPTTTIVVR